MMQVPPYVETGTILLDAVGHAYEATQSQDVDEFGSPKLWLKDLEPGLDGKPVPMEYDVTQLRKLGWTVGE